MSQDRVDPSPGPGANYNDYTVYDQHYNKVGKVDDLFVDEADQPEYIGVKMGLFGTSSTLIPMELVRVNDRRRLVEVAADEEAIKHAPTFEDDNDVSADFEDRVHGYFGLRRPDSMQSGGHYGGYYDSQAEISRDEELRRSVDTEFGERAEPSAHRAGTTPPGAAGYRDLDVPLEEPVGKGPADTQDPFDADAATREGQGPREEIEVQGDRNVRVYKRTRASRG